MDLEDILAQKDRIVLLESLPFDSSRIAGQLQDLAAELTDLFGKPYTLDLYPLSADAAVLREQDLVLINAQGSDCNFISLPGLFQAKKVYEELKREKPRAAYFVLCNFFNHDFVGHEPIRQALRIVFAAQEKGSDPDCFLDSLLGVGYGALLKRSTLVDYLQAELPPLRHVRGNRKNTAFIHELSTAFMQGNSQTGTQRTFLIISDALRDLSGKFDVIAQGSDLAQVDFSRYAAVFVDNNYNFKDPRGSSKIGSGVQVLERLAKLDLGLPLIYQTAHRLEDFTAEEISRVMAFPHAIFMPKNRAFKICNLSKAKKEILVGHILQEDETLSRSCIKLVCLGEEGYISVGEDAIVVTEAVHPVAATGQSNLLQDEIYAHRLEVLAAFHARMKCEIYNPAFAATVCYLRPWEAVAEGVREGRFSLADPDLTRKLYEDLFEKHATAPVTTIIHQDPKWDNWFGGYILGDFGDVGPGTEYKDLARALFDKETDFRFVCTEEFVANNVELYLVARRKFDFDFSSQEDFLRNVQELLFMESLRLARFKSQFVDTESVVSGLLRVADHYQAVLLGDPSTRIPSNGESAPYISLEISSA